MSDAVPDITSETSGGVFDALKGSDLLLRVPVGFASPLWGVFAGAAISGSAWWWMTRFTRIENLEAMFGAAEGRVTATAALPLPAVEAVVGVALETLDAVEAAVETIEPAVEAAETAAADAIDTTVDETLETAASSPIPAVDALTDAVPEPLGGESAPISPVAAALTPETTAEPDAIAPDAVGEASVIAKPKRRVAPPKAD